MSTQISTAFVTQYRDNVHVKYQQEGSKLRGAVTVESPIGEDAYTEILAATAATKRTTRHQDTPLTDSEHARRKYSVSDYEWADLIDKADRVKMLINPDNAYVVNAANAMGRATDDEIITAFDADVLEGHAGGTTTSFPAAQQIAEGNTLLTLAKITASSRILNANNVPQEDRWFVTSPIGLESMLNDTTISSADYNAVRLLMNGQINSFMGYQWIVSTRLPVPGTNLRYCFAWHRRAIKLGVQKDIMTRIDERADKSFSTQVFASMSVGALRVEDAGIVQVAIDEAPA